MYKYKNNKNTNGPQLLRLQGLLKFCFGDSPQRMFYYSLDMLITIVINYHRRQRIVWQKGQTQKIHNVLLPFAFDLWFRRIRLEIIYRFFFVFRKQSKSMSVTSELLQCCHRGSVDRYGGRRIQETSGRASGLCLWPAQFYRPSLAR